MHFSFSLFSFLYICISTSLQSCPQKWEPYGASGNACISIGMKAVDFGNAVSYCKDDTLVTITSMSELQNITSILSQRNISSAWLGLTNIYSSYGIFRWLSGYPSILTEQLIDDSNITNTIDINSCVQLQYNGESKMYQWSVVNCNDPNVKAVPICQVGMNYSSWENTKFLTGRCPDMFFRVNNYCYHVYNNATHGVSWAVASESCKKLHSTSKLATIHNHDVQAFFTAFVATMAWSPWIGLTSLNGSGYHWSSDTDGSYTNWQRGEPVRQDRSKACILMDKSPTDDKLGRWYSDKCTHPQSYICEADFIEDKSISSTNASQSWPSIYHSLLNNSLLNSSKSSDCVQVPNGSTGIVLEYQSMCIYYNTDTNWTSYNDVVKHCRDKWYNLSSPILLHNKQEVSLMHTLMLIRGGGLHHENESIWVNVRARKLANSSDIEIQWGNERTNWTEETEVRVYERINLDLSSRLNQSGFPEEGQWVCYILTISSKYLLPVPCESSVPRGHSGICSYPLKSHPYFTSRAFNTSISCRQDDTHQQIGHFCLTSFLNESMSHFAARKKCTGMNSALFSINHGEVQRRIHRLLQTDHLAPSLIWLNVQVNWVEQFQYYNIHQDNQALKYLHFASDQPRRKSGNHCVVMNVSSGYWQIVPCNEKHAFYCVVSHEVDRRPQKSAEPPKPNPCKAGFHHNNGTCYTVLVNKYSFLNATKACKTLHTEATLASIHSESEHRLLKNVIRRSGLDKNGTLWIGLKTIGTQYASKINAWLDNTPQDFMYFEWTNNLNENDDDESEQNLCGAYVMTKPFVNARWRKYPCSMAMSSICEYVIQNTNQQMQQQEHSTQMFSIPNPLTDCMWGFTSHGKLCYKILHESLTWNDAVLQCARESIHGTLAVVEHEQDNLFFYSLLEKELYGELFSKLSTHKHEEHVFERKFWIGIQLRNFTTHRLDEKPTYFSYWNVKDLLKNETSALLCGALDGSSLLNQGSQWHPLSCTKMLPAICQAPHILRTKLPKLDKPQPLPDHDHCRRSYKAFEGAQGVHCYRRQEGFFTMKEAKRVCQLQQAKFSSEIYAPLHLYSAYEFAFLRSWLTYEGISPDRPIWLGLQTTSLSNSTAASNNWYWSDLPSEDAAVQFTFPSQNSYLSSNETLCYGVLMDGDTLIQDRLVSHPCHDEHVKHYVVCKYRPTIQPSDHLIGDPHKGFEEILSFSGNGSQYLGSRSFSKSGRECVRWDQIKDHNVLRQLKHQFEEAHKEYLSIIFAMNTLSKSQTLRPSEIIYNGLASGANFCRNPNGMAAWPFCYVTDGADGKTAEKEECGRDIHLETLPSKTTTPFHAQEEIKRSSHRASVVVLITFVIVLLFLCILAGMYLFHRRTNPSRSYISYQLQRGEGDYVKRFSNSASFHNPIYTPANC